jgi:hypothetical protein
MADDMTDDKTIQETQARLDAALGRLEKAVATRLQMQAPAATGGASDEELQRLAAELSAADARHEILRQKTDTVTQRIDATITRLKSILEA